MVLSAFDDFPQVKQAFKKGASDYVLKQEVTADKLLELVREARAKLPSAGAEEPAAEPAASQMCIRDRFRSGWITAT